MSNMGLVGIALSLMLHAVAALPGEARAGAAHTAPSSVAGLSTAPRQASVFTTCPEASISIIPLPAGRAHVELQSPCRSGEDVQIRYAGLEFFRRFEKDGRLEFIFDCIGGAEEQATFTFLDGATLQRVIPARDLDQVTKVAVIWRGSVNLDLHAFEYAAGFGQRGHVWASAPSSLAEAQAAAQRDGRGRGFMSLLAEGRSRGDQLEVYTLWRGRNHPQGGPPRGGIIAFALDYASREASPQDPETCGSGVYSEIDYKVVVREPAGVARRSSGAFAPLECGVKLQTSSRYNTKSIPYIK